MSTSRLLLKNTTIYALGDIIPRVLSFFIFPILTSYLSPADYGIINYVNTINVFLLTVGFLCLNTYYLVYYYRVGNEIEQQKLLGNLSIFVVGINVLLTILIYGIGFLFPSTFGDEIAFYPYIAIGVATNLFNILSVLPSALYRVQERPLPLTILNVLKGGLTMGLTIILVVVYKYTALGVLYSTLIISVFFGFIFSWVVFKNAIWNFNWKQLKCALRFSLPLLPGSLAYYFISMSDRIFIERYLDLTQLGIYSTASTLAMLLNIIIYGSYKAFEPYCFKIYGTDRFESTFLKVQKLFCLVVLLGGMGLSLFAQEFFEFFASKQYNTVYYYVPLIEIGIVFSSFSMLYGTILTAQEKTKANSSITIIGGVLSVLLNITLLPVLGLSAACIASAISLGVIMVLSISYSKLYRGLFKPLIAFLVSAFLVFLFVYMVAFNNIWISIIVKAIVFAAGMILCVMILGINWRFINELGMKKQ